MCRYTTRRYRSNDSAVNSRHGFVLVIKDALTDAVEGHRWWSTKLEVLMSWVKAHSANHEVLQLWVPILQLLHKGTASVCSGLALVCQEVQVLFAEVFVRLLAADDS